MMSWWKKLKLTIFPKPKTINKEDFQFDVKTRVPIEAIIGLYLNGKLRIQRHSNAFYSIDNEIYNDDKKRIYLYIHYEYCGDRKTYKFQDKITDEYIELTSKEFNDITDKLDKALRQGNCSTLIDKINFEYSKLLGD